MPKAKQKEKPGKELQDLVALIESLLDDTAEVKSPDKLLDKTSGIAREVDVSILGTIASQQILVIAECRDHKRRVNIQYVEQVKTKRDDVGADRAMIVSRSGFTKAAHAKAKNHNIALMTLEEAMNPSWLETPIFHVAHAVVEIERFQMQVTPADANAADHKAISSDTILYKADGSPFLSLVDFMKTLSFPVYDDVPANQPPISLPCEVQLSEALWIKDGSSLRQIERMVAHLKYSIVNEDHPITAAKYSNQEATVAELAQVTFPVPDQAGVTAKAVLIKGQDGSVKLALEFTPGNNDGAG